MAMNWTAVSAGLLCVLWPACASGEQVRAVIAPNGTVTVPSFELPPSVYLSGPARDALPRHAEDDGGASWNQIAANGNAAQVRAAIVKALAPEVQRLQARYGVRVQEIRSAGLRAYRVIPRHPKPGAILIDLPGGGFMLGNAAGNGMLESIPIAALSGIEVISVDYRQAPEAKFPAASEDVASIYREVLKSHRPRHVGIFGTSAGGLLTAQSLAWFERHELPMPAAAGILSASADAGWRGDSWYWQKPLLGFATAPTLDERFYYAGHDPADPLLSPILSMSMLSRFPPTILITATRAPELSSAVTTHRLLAKAGVQSELQIWDGLGHAFYNNPDLPESREAFEIIAKFFSERLR
jgi:acetyl esterase/lipase